MSTDGKAPPVDWRERQKQLRRALNAKRREQLKRDPRVLAMKQALNARRHAAYQRAKARKQQLAAEEKQRHRERAADERARRDAELRQSVHPASVADEQRKP